jgi:hypothetical protein
LAQPRNKETCDRCNDIPSFSSSVRCAHALITTRNRNRINGPIRQHHPHHRQFTRKKFLFRRGRTRSGEKNQIKCPLLYISFMRSPFAVKIESHLCGFGCLGNRNFHPRSVNFYRHFLRRLIIQPTLQKADGSGANSAL